MRIALLLFLTLGHTLLLQADHITLCPSCTINDMEKAIEIAGEGDTVLVKAGIYPCANLAIAKPVTIIGEVGAVLDGLGEGYVLKLLHDNIRVKGFKIINSGRSYTKDFASIYLFRADSFHISEVEIVNPFFGILIEKSDHGVIRNVRVHGNALKEDDGGNGIHGWHCKNLIIEQNEVSGVRDGIYLEFVDNSQILKNHAYDNVRYGLHFMFSNHDQYIDNTFERNGAGVAVMFSKFIEMRQNHFIQNWGAASYGLLLKEIYDAEVVDNEFIENTTAIFIDGTTRINYRNNLIKQNGWGMKVAGGCYTNRIFENDFISNTFDVSYNSKTNDNTFDGNYWSAYTGYDLDRNGIGDVPYRPVKLFSYIVNNTPETIVLMRSLFVDLINFSERVSPVFTPDNLIDHSPAIHAFR